MSDLWATEREKAAASALPLAARMRPRTLEEFVGQEHILGEGKLLKRMIAADALTSLILHGPPGTGKTALAEVIAASTKRHVERENAAGVGVKRIREIIDEASARLTSSKRRTILFLDEIHRFTRAQQDVLLGDVERGVITLIGATTENPLFAVNSALVSRSTLFRLEPLGEAHIERIVRAALADKERGVGVLRVECSDDALRVWRVKSDGDARRALGALEVAVKSTSPDVRGVIVIDRAAAEDSIQRKAAAYDQTGDEHYDSASALIKSLRAGDPDAAMYWVARMLEGGEDPRFIARRMAILASEDIGNADPHALPLAIAAWEAVERIGMPEARITLGQAAAYLALAPKSSASCVAIDEAMTDAREGRTVPVPLYLRDPNSSPLGSGQRVGKGYEYTQGNEGGIGTQDYLGVTREYYRPLERGFETELKARLERARKMRKRETEG